MRILLVALVCIAGSASAQDSSRRAAFTRWEFRLNPLSFAERFGGLHLGVETNLDSKGKYFFVSEYGWIFLNNTSTWDSEDDLSNQNKVRGFETKQELRKLNREQRRGSSYVGIELHYQQFRIANAGWFGMGETPYAFYKYQSFGETACISSAAFKYIRKIAPPTSRWNMEWFAGVGVIYRDLRYAGTEGTLYDPDAKPVLSDQSTGLRPYAALGLRITLKIR
ncbi:MAG TPA: hypothetical protein VF145_02330 [Chitinophagaceae bacterium]